jgi:hypothetical protein
MESPRAMTIALGAQMILDNPKEPCHKQRKAIREDRGRLQGSKVEEMARPALLKPKNAVPNELSK